MTRAEEIAQQWEDWLPPTPHREAVLALVARGRAAIVQHDPEEAPRLMFEDGGSFELPLVRYDGREPFYSADGAAGGAAEGTVTAAPSPDFRATKYSDVCGTVDEFKRLVAEDSPLFRDEPEYIAERFADIRYMTARMYRRQREYSYFAEALRKLADELAEVVIVDRGPADEGLAEIERMLEDPGCVTVERERLDELAEQVRGVASRQENRLRAHKTVALKLHRLYSQVKGPRDWTQDENAEPEDE